MSDNDTSLKNGNKECIPPREVLVVPASSGSIDWSDVFSDLEQRTGVVTAADNDATCSVAHREENRRRNRWSNVVPFDQHRIKLERVEGNNYINASLVEVPETGDRFVATQGPLRETAEHFWSMIWEQDVRIIVMLCKTVENDMEKCFQYWPTAQEPKDFPTVRVEVTQEDKEGGDFVKRVFRMTDRLEGKARDVVQFHFVRWPDFGVPESPKCFLKFVEAVRKQEEHGEKGSAIAVHCSAGIGRSGSFSLIYSCYKLLERRQTRLTLVEIMTLLSEMRKYRKGLIQTSQQLRFSYQAILELANNLENNRNRPETNGNAAETNGDTVEITGDVTENGDAAENTARRKRTSEQVDEEEGNATKVAKMTNNSHL